MADLSELAKPRTLESNLPVEPPIGSVVLDNGAQYTYADGRPFRVAWQRVGDHWLRCGSVAVIGQLTGSDLDYAQLIHRHGPLTLIHCEEES